MTPLEEKNLSRLIAVISESSLNDDDKSMWLNVIKDMSPMFWESVLASLEGGSGAIEETTNLLKQKIQALETGDKNMWKTILDKEKEELENI